MSFRPMQQSWLKPLSLAQLPYLQLL
jgi:hypothetical protein